MTITPFATSWTGYMRGDLAASCVAKTRTYHSSASAFEYYADCERAYKSVARLARRNLCIPASNIASESLWSLAGYILQDERASASAELIDAQLVVRRNHRECKTSRRPIVGN